MTTILRTHPILSIPLRIIHQRSLTRRCYATEVPRPPPATEKPTVETFSAPSRPKPVFTPQSRSPRLKSWPIATVLTILGAGCWAGFFGYVVNETKATSAVVKQLLQSASMDDNLGVVLGHDVHAEQKWWLNGHPFIHGEINQLQGCLDISIRIRGSLAAGTLYFTATRTERGVPYD
ncbi:cytochrome oxidase complex assembly protein 1-domain-containing protein [Mycena metata]|uniref:Cytochrome oxidase complex assembly protein 1-domain-containing protein n=1 Tax=Mycena metata TaxID=1033252 RepID=A0AAD7ILR1_9AGAR|nr:cytochrome oxidase complex assembly protein 1-domain-containing protein [Mycena metata]